MFPVTLPHLAAANISLSRAETFILPLNDAMIEFDITHGERPAMFVAQVAHESCGFRFLSEIWGPTPAQLRYKDGYEWRGHGLIQITGLENHSAVARFFGMPLNDVVDWLQTPVGACRSAGWFWREHGCNVLADGFDFVGVTRAINGGTTGLENRTTLYAAVAKAMGPG